MEVLGFGNSFGPDGGLPTDHDGEVGSDEGCSGGRGSDRGGR